MTRKVEAIGILTVIAVIALSEILVYRSGKSAGEIDQRLKDNAVATHVADSTSRADSLKVIALRRSSDSALLADVAAHTVYVHDREKVQVSGDTVKSNGAQVVLPDVAKLIGACDLNLAADSVSIHALVVNRDAQDTLIASLYKGIKLRDARIGLLEHEKRPRFGLKTGIVIGAVVVVVASKPAAVFSGIVHALKQVQH